jgi:hypothetical protein
MHFVLFANFKNKRPMWLLKMPGNVDMFPYPPSSHKPIIFFLKSRSHIS